MTDRPIRLAQPRRWTSLALAGATASLAAAAPGLAGHAPAPQAAPARPAAVLVQAEGSEAGEVQPQAGAEGVEGGEAGAAVGQPPDVAYLAELAIVEGHMRAAVLLYDKGMKDEAVGLSYHPEAEMMDQVRADLSAHGVADFTPLMTALSEAMESGAEGAVVAARLADLQTAIAAAAAVEADELATRFAALVVVVKAAAAEYAGAIKDGQVEDAMGFHEAWAFLDVAAAEAQALAMSRDPKAAQAGARVVEALKGAAPAFGDIRSAAVAQDPGILLAVAGRVELAASQVRKP